MTINGLPDVNIQGVPQYWAHFVYQSEMQKLRGFCKFPEFFKTPPTAAFWMNIN